MEELGDLAELGKAWKERARRARLERVSAKKMKSMGIDELIVLCPIGEEDKAKLKGSRTTWQRGSAALVWAILTTHGGRLEGTDITEAIVAYRGCQPYTASAQRSNGIRMLEALGYAEVERQGNRVGTVQLVGKKAKKS